MIKSFLTFLMLVIPFAMSAQWGKATNVRLEHNVPDRNNGRTMIQVHFNMEVHGANGHNIIPAMFVDCPQGTPHHFSDGSNMKADGCTYTSNYEDCHWNGDLWIGIYNDKLNPKPGKNTYYVRVGIWDCNLGRWINDWNNTPYVSYDMTGSAPAPAPTPAPTPAQPSYTPSYIPIPVVPQQTTCVMCGGTGNCSICYGRGISPNHAPGIIAACGGCGGSGRCSTCYGKGWY